MIHFCAIRVLRNAKAIRLTLLLLFTALATQACEICGCSVNGYQFGILPQFKKHFVGVRHQFRSFRSQHLISQQLYILGNQSREYYHSTEVWGRFQVGKKLQLFAFLPYHHFKQVEAGTTSRANGMGDISLMGYYTALNNANQLHRRFKQTLQLGGGIKLPTGRFLPFRGESELNPHLNTGTGSVDYFINGIHTMRYKRIGLTAEASYRINTENQNQFRYGNRLTTAARFFYWKDVSKKVSLLPQVGLSWETADRDHLYADKQPFTGGSITQLVSGIDVFSSHVGVNLGVQIPLQQNLARGLVHTNTQVNVGLTYIF